MYNQNLNMSIIIIGYNTQQPLLKLLQSINNLSSPSDIKEVIYVDDASLDDSYSAFNSYPLLFSKKSKKLLQNSGRSFATQEGINLATGRWFLFVRSNEIIDASLILEYKKTINSQAVAYAGSVKYQSSDVGFENYLNSNSRGAKSSKLSSSIHYKFLLFNNSMIRASVFKLVRLNPQLKHYGGEELDCAYKINQLFPGLINSCNSAIVHRFNYPSLFEHCDRLKEFGNTNLKLLSTTLQLDVIYFQFFLRPLLINKALIFISYSVLKNINYILGRKKLFLFIKMQLFTAILMGYYKDSYSPDCRSSSVASSQKS
tara:strand:- start:1229 stop:2173 length:945 start_codon:yes stop_codon:yes gene_type:complete